MKTVDRKKELGEVFTPPPLVEEILDHIPANYWLDPEETIIDPSGCGWGNFLIGARGRLLQHHSIENILPRVFGLDIMEDNCIETILRLHFDFPLYNDDGTVNEDHREKLIEESEKVSNGTSDYIEVIRLKNIVKDHFRYYAPKDEKKLEKHEATLDNLAYSDVIKRFLRPGLLALFVNKKTGKVIETIVQADGLVYDYSFGDRVMTPREVHEVREENKPKKEENENNIGKSVLFGAKVSESDNVKVALSVKKPKKVKQKVKTNLDILKGLAMKKLYIVDTLDSDKLISTDFQYTLLKKKNGKQLHVVAKYNRNDTNYLKNDVSARNKHIHLKLIDTNNNVDYRFTAELDIDIKNATLIFLSSGKVEGM